MNNKRTDHKGRVLKPGESQRKNKSYQYRYKDLRGNLKTVYAPTLDCSARKKKRSTLSSSSASTTETVRSPSSI